MGARGPKPWKASEETIAMLKLWAGCGSTQEQCATMLGISIDTLKRDQAAKTAFEVGKAEAIAKIGGGVAKRAMAGSTSDAIFYLKTQAGWKEVNAHEHTGRDGAPIETADKTDPKIIERSLGRIDALVRALTGTGNSPAAKAVEE